MPRTSAHPSHLSAVAIAACVFSAVAADAQDAGNGRVLMQDRQILVADSAKIAAGARQQAEKLWQRF